MSFEFCVFHRFLLSLNSFLTMIPLCHQQLSGASIDDSHGQEVLALGLKLTEERAAYTANLMESKRALDRLSEKLAASDEQRGRALDAVAELQGELTRFNEANLILCRRLDQLGENFGSTLANNSELHTRVNDLNSLLNQKTRELAETESELVVVAARLATRSSGTR